MRRQHMIEPVQQMLDGARSTGAVEPERLGAPNLETRCTEQRVELALPERAVREVDLAAAAAQAEQPDDGRPGSVQHLR